jgi:ABC-2 type transport system ATP-binding protein
VNVEIIRDAVLDLRAKGASIILSTHDMNIAETLCQALCMVSRGKKVLDGTPDSIRAQYGQDILRVKTADGAAVLEGLPFIESVRDLGNTQEFRLQKNGDPQAILGELMKRTRIQAFEVARPSLHDIFVRTVRGENGGHGDA